MLTRLFPTPSFLTLPAVGIDFSDATMRFVQLSETINGLMPTRYAEMAIPEGCMKGGRIADEQQFTSFLAAVRDRHNLKYVRVAIPESQTYSFTLALDIVVADDIRSAIELVLEDNIPLRVAETIFDYHILKQTEEAIVVQVVAISQNAAESFCNSFLKAGLIPVSFELDGQAVARATIRPDENGSYMVVDFGAYRTGITIVTANTAVFTSTLEFGGKSLVDNIQKELNVTPEEARRLKREYGLSSGGGEYQNVFNVLVAGISTLKDEINRRYVYWHEKKVQQGEFSNIDTVYLCGGHSNMRGLADYLSVGLKLSVTQANPWINCVSFDKAIPDMPYEESMSYVTAIGLALSDYQHE